MSGAPARWIGGLVVARRLARAGRAVSLIEASDRLGGTVARLIVHMQAGQAVRTVIPVVAARACRYDRTAAHPAGEAVVTGMRFVITFLILLAFILPIHGNSS